MDFYDSSDSSDGEAGSINDQSTKLKITDGLIDETLSSVEVTKKYNVKYRTIRMWVCKRRKHKFLKVTTGRPRILDEISVSNVEQFIAENPGASTELLKDELRREHHETYVRRVAITGAFYKYRVMPPTTVRRYLAELNVGQST